MQRADVQVLPCTGIASALEELEKLGAGRSRPLLVLLGPNLESPVAAARRIRREAPLAAFAFLAPGTDPALEQQLRSPFAMVGNFWNVIDLASASASSLLLDTANAVRQRLQLRTTISRFNVQLSSSSAADISELRRYTVSDRFLADLLEHARDAVIGTNNAGIVVTWNESAVKMFQKSREEAAGLRIDELVGGDWPRRLKCLLAEIRSVEFAREELTCERFDGQTLDVELMLSLVRDEAGNPIGLSAVVRDISSRKRMEAERSKLEEQLRQTQKLESLGILAGGIAHDFNNLLTGILGNVELAAFELPRESPGRKYIKDAKMAAIRAAELCKQMLAYSGRGRFEIQALDLNQVLEEAAALMSLPVSKKTTIRYDLHRELPAIEADATQIRQVAMNLITNAAEAIGDNEGVIAIRTGVKTCDSKYLAQTLLDDDLEPGPFVYFEVSDTGSGMDRETRKRIFDPFFTTKFIGRGLGLAAVLGIVRGHGGAIDVDSEEGRGTTLRILFPCPTERTVEPVQETPRIHGIRGAGKVLVIDDEESVRAVARASLERIGLDVVTAADGREGLEILEGSNERLLLVLLDLTMPQLNGDEVLKEMRRMESDVPVILTSGYSEEELSDRFAGKGLAGFLQKPLRPTVLIAKIEELIERERLREPR